MRSSTVGKSSNARWVWIVIAIVVAVAVICTAAFFMIKKSYVAVYLVTGDIYYGKLSCFPKFTLDDALFLQRGEDGSLGLQKLSDAFWKPKGPMVIERDQIVFWSKLDPESPVVDAIEGRAMPQTQQQAPTTTTPPTTTTTPEGTGAPSAPTE
jgi:hypothetical protein